VERTIADEPRSKKEQVRRAKSALHEGDAVALGDAIVGAYVNLGVGRPVYLLSFAFDALGPCAPV
jgi:hypothetical protein